MKFIDEFCELFPGWKYNDIMAMDMKKLYALRDKRIARKLEEHKAQTKEEERIKREQDRLKHK